MKDYNKNTYTLPVGETDLARMDMLNSIYMPYCSEFLLEHGLKPGLTIADIGCGPGNVSLWLSKQVGDSGKVISIDNSPKQLQILNERIAANNIKNITVYQHNVYDIDSLNERFDLVFCRFLLIHLANPMLAITKLATILKPGGRLILAEVDNSTWYSYPEHEALQRDIKLLCQVGTYKQADFCLAPQLYGYLRQQHFKDIHVKIAQPVLLDEQRQYLLLKNQAWRDVYRELDLVSAEEQQQLLKGFHELVENKDYLLAAAKIFLIAGRKES